MIRVATYARFSTDKQRDASIEDQLRNCKNYAKRHSWNVVKHFEDRGISVEPLKTVRASKICCFRPMRGTLMFYW